MLSPYLFRHRRLLSRFFVLLFAAWALVQGAAATAMPACDHLRAGTGGEMTMAADEHQHAGHMMPATDSGDDPAAGGDCQGCGFCHFACSTVAMTASELLPPLLAGADAPPVCAARDCVSHVGAPPHDPPRTLA